MALLQVAALLAGAAVVSAVTLGVPRRAAAASTRGRRSGPTPRLWALWAGGESAGAVSGVGVGLNLTAVVAFPLVAGVLLDAGLGFTALWLVGAIGALAAAAAFLRTREPRGTFGRSLAEKHI